MSNSPTNHFGVYHSVWQPDNNNSASFEKKNEEQ